MALLLKNLNTIITDKRVALPVHMFGAAMWIPPRVWIKNPYYSLAGVAVSGTISACLSNWIFPNPKIHQPLFFGLGVLGCFKNLWSLSTTPLNLAPSVSTSKPSLLQRMTDTYIRSSVDRNMKIRMNPEGYRLFYNSEVPTITVDDFASINQHLFPFLDSDIIEGIEESINGVNIQGLFFHGRTGLFCIKLRDSAPSPDDVASFNVSGLWKV
jgi:hypothetical protein